MKQFKTNGKVVSEYLKPGDYKDPEENLYIIIQCWW